MTVRNIAAIDLGASSGRVMLASYHSGTRRIAAWVIGLSAPTT
jgi:rhamnulokinase